MEFKIKFNGQDGHAFDTRMIDTHAFYFIDQVRVLGHPEVKAENVYRFLGFEDPEFELPEEVARECKHFFNMKPEDKLEIEVPHGFLNQFKKSTVKESSTKKDGYIFEWAFDPDLFIAQWRKDNFKLDYIEKDPDPKYHILIKGRGGYAFDTELIEAGRSYYKDFYADMIKSMGYREVDSAKINVIESRSNPYFQITKNLAEECGHFSNLEEDGEIEISVPRGYLNKFKKIDVEAEIIKGRYFYTCTPRFNRYAFLAEWEEDYEYPLKHE